jgi:hypothetical protein
MKHITPFEDFVNESKKEKMSGATYWEEVNIPGVGNSNTVKADNDATKAAQALVTVWEKGKKFDDFTVSADDIKKLTNIANAKANEVITIKLVDGKADKDYQIKMEMRDTALGVPKKNVYTWVTRVG